MTKVTADNQEEVAQALSIGAKINDLGWPWRAIMHSVLKRIRLSEPTMKIWMKIDPYCHRGWCSPMTLVVSGNIRFMQISAGVPWTGGVLSRENVDFQGFRCHRHLRKWGQHYYTILFSPLSSFHWPQNTLPWMSLNSHFTLNFHYYKQRFHMLFYILTIEPIHRIFLLYHVTSRDMRKRTVIGRIFGIRGRTEDLSFTKSCGRYTTSSDP